MAQAIIASTRVLPAPEAQFLEISRPENLSAAFLLNMLVIMVCMEPIKAPAMPPPYGISRILPRGNPPLPEFCATPAYGPSTEHPGCEQRCCFKPARLD